MRIRVTFAKTEAMRYTGHLDLYRAWERLLRRAGLPLAYSQGFRPHARINLASALPLGFTSRGEVVDIWLESSSSIDAVEAALQQSAPPGLEILQMEEVEERAPTLQAQLEASEFDIILLEPLPDLDRRLEELLNSERIERERRGKPYDLRPLILDLRRLPDDEEGLQRLCARLAAMEGATGRPEELVLALGGEPEKARVQRTRLVFRDTAKS